MKSRNLLTGIIAALAGFLFVASSVTAEGTNLRTGGVEDLRRYIIDKANKLGSLEGKVNAVQTQVDKLSVQGIDPKISAKITALSDVAGLTAVSGSALQVTLDDAPRVAGAPLADGVAPDDLVVHQQDVQSVVNAFWRSGATAVQVMDQRLVSTSAIRCVGNTLWLQGRVYSPPFKVVAIGDVTELQAGLDSEPGVQIYRQYVDKLGLGWKVSILNQTTIPAWQGTATK